MIVVNNIETPVMGVGIPFSVYQEIFSYMHVGKVTDNYEHQFMDDLKAAVHKYVEVNLPYMPNAEYAKMAIVELSTVIGLPLIIKVSPVKLMLHSSIVHRVASTILNHIVNAMACRRVTVHVSSKPEDCIYVEVATVEYDRITARMLTFLACGFDDIRRDGILAIYDYHGISKIMSDTLEQHGYDFKLLAKRPIASWGWDAISQFRQTNLDKLNTEGLINYGLGSRIEQFMEAVDVTGRG